MTERSVQLLLVLAAVVAERCLEIKIQVYSPLELGTVSAFFGRSLLYGTSDYLIAKFLFKI